MRRERHREPADHGFDEGRYSSTMVLSATLPGFMFL
jgi:hypothetical protein